MRGVSKLNVGIVSGKEWIEQCDRLPGALRKRVSSLRNAAGFWNWRGKLFNSKNQYQQINTTKNVFVFSDVRGNEFAAKLRFIR